MFLRFFTAAAAFVGTPILNSSLTVSDCGKGASVFTIEKLAINPTNPAPGAEFELHMEWTVPGGVNVTGGTAEYDLTWNFIPFDPTIEPLCQDIPCPMLPGAYQNTTISTWPSGVSGLVTSQMKWFDEAQTLLACVEIGGTARGTADVADSKALVVYSQPPVGRLRGSRRLSLHSA